MVPTDLSAFGMLQVGRQRKPGLSFVAADALALPFGDGSFDAVTISFGLRNVEDTDGCAGRLPRVTRPGGVLVVCEFSTPVWRPFRSSTTTIWWPRSPRLASLRLSNPVAYGYLAESIQAWPDQPSLAAAIGAAGWRDVEWRNLSGGVVALHRARS